MLSRGTPNCSASSSRRVSSESSRMVLKGSDGGMAGAGLPARLVPSTAGDWPSTVGTGVAGVVADLVSVPAAIYAVAAITGLSGVAVAVRMYETHPQSARV